MVVARDGAAVAAGPHDVGVGGIGNREAGFASAEPVIPRGEPAAAPTTAKTTTTESTSAGSVCLCTATAATTSGVRHGTKGASSSSGRGGCKDERPPNR